MKKYNVVNTMNVGNNTAVIIDGSSEMFSKGTVIISDSGTSYQVMSVGMLNGEAVRSKARNTTLVIRGRFQSPKIYV